MKKIILYTLAGIGILSILFIGYQKVLRRIEVNEYWENCQNVKVGMTLREAQEIMGDYLNLSKTYTSSMMSPREPIREDSTFEFKYCRAYPSPTYASVSTKIYFDPLTQIVTGVVCGDSY